MPLILRLCEDVLSNGSTIELPPLPRMIFVVHGSIEVEARAFVGGEAWHGDGAVTLKAGHEGATGWRFELATGDGDKAVLGRGAASRHKLSARLDRLADGDILLRGDSVAFPPGGCAYLHRHQGPGLRCLLEGGIRIDTHGASTCYGPGGAWYESGPEPVFAQAAADRPSRFIRVMVLPRALIGKSSIQYVDEADKAGPKSQQYQIFCDAPIARP
jgi:hypothetical protein